MKPAMSPTFNIGDVYFSAGHCVSNSSFQRMKNRSKQFSRTRVNKALEGTKSGGRGLESHIGHGGDFSVTGPDPG